MRVLVCDPGESTGWLLAEDDRILAAGTVPKNHHELYKLLVQLIDYAHIDILVYETFQLYPGKAASQAWSTFYTCEVIGILKLFSILHEAKLIGYAPSVKKYAGDFKDDWRTFVSGRNLIEVPEQCRPITEHTKDTYRLWSYFKRMNKK